MLDIVGGTYYEHCVDPNWKELFGSGLRAVVGLAPMVKNIRFHTYADNTTSQILEHYADQLRVSINCSNITASIEFLYQHPLVSPVILGEALNLEHEIITLRGLSKVLVYGMLEGNAIIHGEQVVYDPQNSYSPIPFSSNGSSADKLVYVLNYAEALKIAASSDLAGAKKYLLGEEKCLAAIIKHGSNGAILVRKGVDDEYIPLYQTARVWPIGSGDIFSAGFALNWLVNGEDITTSAHKASLSTANYVNTRTLPINDRNVQGFKPLNLIGAAKKKVYLAGPFFTMGERWMLEQARTALSNFGFDVFSPLHDVGIGSPAQVVDKDLAGIRNCDLVYAIIDGLDSGTLFELGYAVSLGKPVICFGEGLPQQDMTMLIGTNCAIVDDFSTSIYLISWLQKA